jgi:hypothetical protein
MYWYLTNLHTKQFRKISRKKVQRNFAEFREIKITFVVISYFAKYKKSYFATNLVSAWGRLSTAVGAQPSFARVVVVICARAHNYKTIHLTTILPRQEKVRRASRPFRRKKSF